MNLYKRFNTNKYGITMMTLVITIVVSLIIVTVGIATVSSSVSDATLTAFADDLTTIQDQTNLYYLQNDSFPTPDDSKVALSQNDILNIVKNDDSFIEELKLNDDYNESNTLGEFYKIDISKLNIEKTVRGTLKNGEESDIYIVSAKTMNVYYLKGIEVNNVIYYSLSSKIIKYVKTTTATEENTDNTSIQTVGSLTAKLASKDWTASDRLGLTLNAYMNSGESLYINIPDVGEKQVNGTSVGNNTFIFNSFNDIQNKVPTLTSEDINVLNSKQGNEKYIEFVKRNSTKELDRLKIDLSNWDTIAPIRYSSDISFTENTEENKLTFQVADYESGIKQVRYEYLKKYNEVGLEEDYYAGVQELTASYIKQKGKKATFSDTDNKNIKNVEIILPKEISKVQILVLDNADNWILITKTITTDFYIGATLNTINEGGALFRVAFNNKDGISNYSISVSTDNGATYSTSISKNPNSKEVTYYEVISDYKEGLKITNNLYVKIVATDNNNTVSSRKNKTRIVKFSLADAKSGSYLGDNVVDMVSGVPIPKGFVASKATGENDKNNGLVIYEGTDAVTDSNLTTARTTRNQYVWIPVEYSEFSRAIPSYNTETQMIEWNAPAGSWQEVTTTPEYIEMSESIKKYGGFYIARYEAGIPSNIAVLEQGNDTESKERALSLCSQGVKPVSMKEANVWNYMPWGTTDNSTTNIGGTDPIDKLSGNQTADGAVKASRSVYPNVERLTQYGLSPKLTNNTGVISTLCYAVCRDSVMRFVSDSVNPSTGNPYITDSTGMGWYRDNFSSNWYLTTGKDVNTSAFNKVKNIYDLGGNVLEWTMEAINRGSTGTYTRTLYGGTYTGYSPASYKTAGNPSDGSKKCGFRIMLYIK